MALNKRQRLILRWSLLTLLATVGIAAVSILTSGDEDPYAAGSDGRIEGLTDVMQRDLSDDMVRFRFEEISAHAGIDFRHFPATRQSLLPEDMGSGVAWGDFDNDGDPDLFLVNFSGPIHSAEAASAGEGHCALYRNNGDGSFSDISVAAGADLTLFGMGAAWGDYDNDGWPDLYVTAYGSNVLLRNRGDGTFTDVTAAAGVGDASFSAGATWFDSDNDGWIDLYVANYVTFEFSAEDASNAHEQYATEVPYTLNPSSYPPAANRLYRNLGNGRFAEVASHAGLDNLDGRSLQAAAFDFDLDGSSDLYVANDVSANGVFRSLGEGRFEDIGASSLAADYRGAMGLAVAGYNHDGLLDLFISHWLAQENALFENMTRMQTESPADRQVLFMEVGQILGLGHSSLRMVGWATGFADFDNDAQVDLWVVNGHTLQQREDPIRLVPQSLQLFRRTGQRSFVDIAARAWPDARPLVGRGGAHADFDGDGRLDLAVNVHGGRALLLHNVSEATGNWVALRLSQRDHNTAAIGARVVLRTAGMVQSAQRLAGSSYLSQHGGDLHFGLGASEVIDELTIHWPDGQVDVLRDLVGNRVIERQHQPHY